MNIKRAKRYKDKLDMIGERISDIREWLHGYNMEEFISDKKTRLAVYKAFQEIVEASFDIAAMLCKDSKITPKDDYANAENLYKAKILDESLKNALIEANGLRNRIVHRYNKLDDTIAFESIQELLEKFESFTEVVKEWLKKRI